MGKEKELGMDDVLEKMKVTNKFSSFLMKKIVIYGSNNTNSTDPPEFDSKNMKMITHEEAYFSVTNLIKRNSSGVLNERDLTLIQNLEIFVNLKHNSQKPFFTLSSKKRSSKLK